MEPQRLNKNPFARHGKDAVPPPDRRYLGAWESSSAEGSPALGTQPVSACLLGPGSPAPAFLPLLRASWIDVKTAAC